MRRAGVDDDEAVLLSEASIRAAGVISLCSTSTVVNGYDDAGRSCELFWYVDVETSLCGSSPERCDLRERSRYRCTLSQGGCGRQREVACDEYEEAHSGFRGQNQTAGPA